MKHDSVFSALFGATLVASVCLNVVQAKRIHALLVGPLDAAHGPGRPKPLPPLAVEDLTGHPVTVRPADYRQPTVVYVFSPSCHWCESNVPLVRALAQSAGRRYHFIAVSLSDEGLDEYVRGNDIGMAAYYKDPSEQSRAAYRMGATPTTMVITPDGRMLAFWMGAYVGRNLAAIEQYFSVHLPGDLPLNRVVPRQGPGADRRPE